MAASSSDVDQYTRVTPFWRSASPFSQWYPANFTIAGIQYNCAEQYMMHQKAVVFGDDQAAANIMTTDDPKKQKAFGRKVKNFDADVWDEKCRDIVKEGSRAKFSQNEELQKALFATAGTVLAEASPVDRIWGIGMAEDNPLVQDRSSWKGKNWLGYALTQVRDELMMK